MKYSHIRMGLWEAQVRPLHVQRPSFANGKSSSRLSLRKKNYWGAYIKIYKKFSNHKAFYESFWGTANCSSIKLFMTMEWRDPISFFCKTDLRLFWIVVNTRKLLLDLLFYFIFLKTIVNSTFSRLVFSKSKVIIIIIANQRYINIWNANHIQDRISFSFVS